VTPKLRTQLIVFCALWLFLQKHTELTYQEFIWGNKAG